MKRNLRFGLVIIILLVILSVLSMVQISMVVKTYKCICKTKDT